MDLHCEMLLQEYRDIRESANLLQKIAEDALRSAIRQNGIYVTAIESRVKTESSLAGKLELKGQKYAHLSDITDIVGARVITFYSDEVDKVAALAENLFEIDWENSADKRKAYGIDRFGYMSLHYICRIPKALYFDETHPEINTIRFELQIRTALQHVWATVFHDMGYKTDVDIPKEYMRRMSCMAGMLEIADREFLSFRTEVEDYRRKVRALIRDTKFDEILLDKDSFDSYLEIEPFRMLNERIASINHAEIETVSMKPYLNALHTMGFETLGDIERMKQQYSEDAYNLARHQIGNTDLDIIASTKGIYSLCVVYLLKNGGGEADLLRFHEALYGKQERGTVMMKRLIAQAQKANII